MLFVVATPIGNLSDFSFRSIEVLKNADLILCEDTRHSLKLLNHYDIHRPLVSFHKFNEQKNLPKILNLLKQGRQISLISDAGTPLVADPGQSLIEACIQENIEVSYIPGPCALIHALVCSGFTWECFQFIGFLPLKEKPLRKLLYEILKYPGITISYEAPHRLLGTLHILSELKPYNQICLARELTKKHESFLRGTSEEITRQITANPIKGECVLLIKGEKDVQDYSEMDLEEHVIEVQSAFHVTKNEAIKIVAQIRGINKRDLYRKLHKTSE